MRRLWLLIVILNMGILHIPFSIFSFFNPSIFQSFPSSHAATVGEWKAYMAYHDVTEIEEAGNLLYVLASNNLYSYNRNDQSIQTFDKVNLLSDCYISHIAYCKNAKRLVIVYENENIDLLDLNSNVTNVAAYYNVAMTGDKTVYDIYIDGNYAYLSTGFGIIKLNVKNAEISDTYQLGFKVDYSYISNGSIYAASSTNGLYSASLTDNLLDKNNWSRVGDYTAKTKTIDPELLALTQTLNPGGPKYNYFGFLKFINGQLYSCGGTLTNQPATIQILKENEWSIYQDEGISEQTGVTYQDLVCIDVDPTDETHLFAGGRNGVYEYKNGQFVKFYNHENSPIASAFTHINKEYEMVTGLIFSKNGNLWCINSSSTQSLIEYTKEQQWISHPQQELMRMPNGRSLALLSKMIIDSRGLLWFVNNNNNIPGLFCYQFSTDAINSYTSFINEDGTTVSIRFGRCVTEDKDGNIWFGTDVGPLMLEPSEFNSDNPVFQQIKVPRNDGTNYADYLLDGVDISSIAIDGAGRKWFGTNGNGVYLISEDNYEQIHHFTASNSKLLSDNIESIAIDQTTGEIFFGTDKGLCSYMSDATTPNEEMTKDNVWAYPNPVRPDYTGLIRVTGLSYNADVKIVTTNGVLVAEGKSNGGLFTWDGCDKKGKRVASGVYMVQTATQDGKKGTVCKIAIIN